MGNCPKHAQNLKKKRKGKERLKPWGTPGGEIRHHVVTTASLYHTCHQRPLLKLSCPTECWSLAKSGVMEGPRMHSWVRSAPVRLDCLAGSSWPRDSVRPFPAGALLQYRVWVQTHLPICTPAHKPSATSQLYALNQISSMLSFSTDKMAAKSIPEYFVKIK